MSWSQDKRCLYCGTKLPLYRKVLDEQFCSDAHRKSFRADQDQLALRALQDSHQLLTRDTAAPPTEAPAKKGRKKRAEAHTDKAAAGRVRNTAAALKEDRTDPSSNPLFRQEMPQEEEPARKVYLSEIPVASLAANQGLDDLPLRDFASAFADAVVELPEPSRLLQLSRLDARILSQLAPLEYSAFALAVPEEIPALIWEPPFREVRADVLAIDLTSQEPPAAASIAFLPEAASLVDGRNPARNIAPIENENGFELATPELLTIIREDAPVGDLANIVEVESRPISDSAYELAEIIIQKILPVAAAPSSVPPASLAIHIAPIEKEDEFELATPEWLSVSVEDQVSVAPIGSPSETRSELAEAVILEILPSVVSPVPVTQASLSRSIAPIENAENFELATPEIFSTVAPIGEHEPVSGDTRTVETEPAPSYTLAALLIAEILPRAAAPVTATSTNVEIAAVECAESLELAIPETLSIAANESPDLAIRGVDAASAPASCPIPMPRAAAPASFEISAKEIAPLENETGFELASPKASMGSPACALRAQVAGSVHWYEPCATSPRVPVPLASGDAPLSAELATALPRLSLHLGAKTTAASAVAYRLPLSIKSAAHRLRSDIRAIEIQESTCELPPWQIELAQNSNFADLLALSVEFSLARKGQIAPRTGLRMEWTEPEALLPKVRLEPYSPGRDQFRLRGSVAFWAGEAQNGINPRKAIELASDFWKHAPRDFKLLAFVIPVALALVFHPGLPKVHVKASPELAKTFSPAPVAKTELTQPVNLGPEPANETASASPSDNAEQAENATWQDALRARFAQLRKTVASRAGVELNEDFRSGMDEWQGAGDSVADWSFDRNGFVKPAALALYRPSMPLRDYDMEFLGLIDKKALSFAARAQDTQNYYAMKLVVLKPGPVPTVGLVRYPVINGKAEKAVETRVPLDLRADTIYRVSFSVHDDTYLLMVQGNVVDSWSETRLKRGGIGFFADKGEENRVRWVQVSHQYDMLGRLCAYLAPLNPQTTNGSW